MRIAISQSNHRVGAVDENIARIEQAHARARAEGLDLVVLTEMAITGYPPRDLLERRELVDAGLRGLDRIAALSSGGPAVLVGFVEPNRSGRGKPLHNAAALCAGGQVLGVYRKCLLPTYDVFDEDRWFEPGDTARCLTLGGVRIGVTICEDIWTDPRLLPVSLYHRDPVRELLADGADLLVNLSASPFALGKGALRRELVRHHAQRTERWFLYANQVGGNDELVFDGHSLAVDPRGHVVRRGASFREDFVVVDTEADERGDAGGDTAAEADPAPEAEAREALVLGLRDYVGKCRFRDVVLGLSGGIDSALTAALAVEALGPEHVLGVAMPGPYSSDHSLTDARSLAQNLGIEFDVIPIGTAYDALLTMLGSAFAGTAFGVAEENVQARVRGATLMALSNKFDRLLLTTGNKSELAVGYCTLYGDMCGGLAVISDLPKTLVYGVCRLINRERTIIPESTLTKPPSAELRPNQTDQDTLPPYDVLDAILERYVEAGHTAAEIAATGIDASTVTRVIRMINGAEYKRRQAAPGIKLTWRAFGSGRRYPIAADYGVLLPQ